MMIMTSQHVPPTKYLTVKDGERLAYWHQPGKAPGIMFLPGFQSTMKSKKSAAILGFCQKDGLEFTTLDYYGHGQSSGSDSENGSIERWMSDAINILDGISEEPDQIIIGSSMGAWLMMLLMIERAGRIKGLVGIASAPDFTHILQQQIENDKFLSKQMESSGYCDLPTKYDTKGYYRIHKRFLHQAASLFILSSECKVDVPLRLIHGKNDEDILWHSSQALYDKVISKDKELIIVDGGDHRLSKPHELKVILDTLKNII
eukprot:scaffold2006_cov283-Chaetoceros_neogracile.AAC.9